jgi:hypothetical protein
MKNFLSLFYPFRVNSVISGEGRAKAGHEVKLFSAIQVDSRSWFFGCRIKSGMTENFGLSSYEQFRLIYNRDNVVKKGDDHVEIYWCLGSGYNQQSLYHF